MKKIRFPLFVLMFLSCNKLKIAYESYELKDFRKTIKECLLTIRDDSTNSEAYFLMGNAYLELGEKDSAVSAFSKAALIEPENSAFQNVLYETFVQLGEQKAKENNIKMAMSYYDKALSIMPGNSNVLEQKGDVYYKIGQHEKAKTEYQKALFDTRDSTKIDEKIAKIDRFETEADNYVQCF